MSGYLVIQNCERIRNGFNRKIIPGTDYFLSVSLKPAELTTFYKKLNDAGYNVKAVSSKWFLPKSWVRIKDVYQKLSISNSSCSGLIFSN